MIRTLVLALAALTLASCVDDRPAGHRMSASEKADCTTKGGEVHVGGMLGAEFCLIPYEDAGKACRKSSDCMGICEVADEKATSGTCSANNNGFGCYSYLDDAGEVISICVD